MIMHTKQRITILYEIISWLQKRFEENLSTCPKDRPQHFTIISNSIKLLNGKYIH
jgi:hypothetical protein